MSRLLAMQYLSESEEETLQIGAKLAEILPLNSVVCFFGDLGAGKTTLIKGLASHAVNCSPYEVNSPTFVYLNIYEGDKKIYHFDLYRLSSSEEFLSMGFDDMFHAGGICCLEWAERITDLLPENIVKVKINSVGERSRKIEIEGLE